MKKIIFYISIIIFLYLIYIILNILLYHFENLNNYGNGFLIGKFILLIIFGLLIYKTSPFILNRKVNKH
ncbi:MAG: hypothetical protein ACI9FW_000764 [Flavobacterium sp.]|jgi:hypothetical protein